MIFETDKTDDGNSWDERSNCPYSLIEEALEDWKIARECDYVSAAAALSDLAVLQKFDASPEMMDQAISNLRANWPEDAVDLEPYLRKLLA